MIPTTTHALTGDSKVNRTLRGAGYKNAGYASAKDKQLLGGNASDAYSYLAGRRCNKGVDTAKLNNQFVVCAAKFLKKFPSVCINSAYRSPASQLKACMNICGRSSCPGKCAPPGRSKHQKGLAVDIKANPRSILTKMHAAAPADGLINPPSIRRTDPVHFQSNGAQCGHSGQPLGNGSAGQGDGTGGSPPSSPAGNGDSQPPGGGGGSPSGGGGDSSPPGGGNSGTAVGDNFGPGGVEKYGDDDGGDDDTDSNQSALGDDDTSSTSDSWYQDTAQNASSTASTTGSSTQATGSTNGISNSLIKYITDNIDNTGDFDKIAYRFLLARLEKNKTPANIYGLNPQFAQCTMALLRASEARGFAVTIKSGYRPYEVQAEIYKRATTRHPGTADLVEEAPNISTHVNGVALDFIFPNEKTSNWLYKHSKEFGLNFSNEYRKEHMTTFTNLCASNTASQYGINADKKYQPNKITLPDYTKININSVPQVKPTATSTKITDDTSKNTVRTKRGPVRRFFFNDLFKNRDNTSNAMDKINQFFNADIGDAGTRMSWFQVVLRMLGM